MSENASSAPQSRGPADHNVREQIVEAAEEHFSHYGYDKTTVSDLAKSIGFSKAYIYKFFDSKQAIGEAICSRTLSAIIVAVEEAVADAPTATEKFRRMFKALVATGSNLFFNDRKLYDIAAHSAGEGWPSARAYVRRIEQILMEIVREGRESGEFERKTPLDETVHSIFLVMQPYVNPLLLQYNLDLVEEAPVQLSNLVLRSLAP
ncbi:TetR/AcrR family transcriptional regulator [Halomonas heilongjiangensis]|uniref:TetR family transcriptional regulator n=1 Tax=Halomonas heilongjiangensis TaxID=1387883 RepID=A0A2N7TLD5_9GAMM|nr:TetR/AcrR family transcriptional regulator [Halomonas heilongjiangensis]PMR69006.1 TetR family transcriptional regulator [Halomonas heilongjiangensis]PXX90036.1 TetR family transcriptional regulator [Halomonas heilongjiangensis]